MTNDDKNSLRPTPFTLILAAAGTGSRFDADRPKQYWPIHGKPLIRHTVERFMAIPDLKDIYIAVHPAHMSQIKDAMHGLDGIKIVRGSETRKKSVFNALMEIPNQKNEDIILVHDAARPFFDPADVLTLLQRLQHNTAAALSCAVSDTLVDPRSGIYPDRASLRAIQTPQGFHYGTIFAAHDAFKDQESGFTDDTSLVIAHGGHVEFIDANPQNFKITHKSDLTMAETMLSAAGNTAPHPQIRTGLGFDVHAFDTAPAQSLRLGGLDIPYTRKLKGHSDADVVLHTITDALLGALALGDIGDHFPPSDNTFKNMDSMVFLKKAHDLLQERGARIINVDVTIMCEAPKLFAYKKPMQSHIEHALGLAEGSISIKATTTERLGFTGREEGIAAQAVATIEIGGEIGGAA